MRKILLSISLIITLAFGANAQNDAFFKWNDSSDDAVRPVDYYSFSLPTSHGAANDYQAPLGNDLLILALLGVGYVRKRSKQ